MGISIDLLPMMGLGVAMHFSVPLLEIVFGPFVIMIGDIDAYNPDEQ